VAGDITAVVTYDVSRLYMLEGLCLLWGGPLAAAVYVVRPCLHGCIMCSRGSPQLHGLHTIWACWQSAPYIVASDDAGSKRQGEVR
jgi:hypothetical protein